MAEAIGELRPGGVLEVRTDDPGATMELLLWCDMTGETFMGTGNGQGYMRYFNRKEVKP